MKQLCKDVDVSLASSSVEDVRDFSSSNADELGSLDDELSMNQSATRLSNKVADKSNQSLKVRSNRKSQQFENRLRLDLSLMKRQAMEENTLEHGS